MMESTFISELKQRVLSAENEVAFLQSKLDSFFSGNTPDGSTLDHVILAKWGRKRLEEMGKKPVLLKGNALG